MIGDIGKDPGIRPPPGLGRRLDAAARACVPGSTAALLMLLTAAPFGFPQQAALLPAIALSAVYFWTVFRPASMPSVLVFCLGLLLDLLGYLPLGAGVLSLLIAHGAALRSRAFIAKQTFLVVWLIFIACAGIALALQWALASLLAFQLLPISIAALQIVVSAALYPALAVIFGWAHRTIAAPELA